MNKQFLKSPSVQVDKAFASQKLSNNQSQATSDQQQVLLNYSDGGSSREILSEVRRDNRFMAFQHGKRKSHRQVSKYDSEEEIQTVKEKKAFRYSLQKLFEETFAKNLIDRTYARKLNQLSHYQISVLDDLQFGTDKEVDDINNIFFKFFTKYFDKWSVIQPQSSIKMIWNIIILLNTFVIYVWLPYKMSFEINYIIQLFVGEEIKSISFEILIFIILIVDIFVSLNQAYISRGIIINQRYYILTNYIKHLALPDILCLGTMLYQLILVHQQQSQFEQDYISMQISFCIIFCILKQIKIYNLFTQLQEYFNVKGLKKEMLFLVKIFLGIMYVIHLCACVWYGIGTKSDNFTWVDQHNLRDASNAIKYAYSIHWSAMYLTTVGQSDLMPQNQDELFFGTVVSILSLIVVGVVIVTIGFFFHKLQQNNLSVQSLKIMNNFMSLNKIDFNLQVRIRNYLDYICKEEQSMIDEDVSTIVGKLSSSLQNELKYQLRASLLEQCTIFSQNFSFKLRKALVNYMTEMSTTPEQRILTLNEVDDSSIYIINKGEVEIIHEGENKIKERVKRNQIKICDFFGAFGFITGFPRTATVLSKGFCRLFKITREDFVKILNQFPDDKEIFYMIRDEVTINEDYRHLYIKCYSCKSSNHMVNRCPYLHFVPDVDRVIKQEFYPQNQIRDDPYFPQKSKYLNALFNMHYIVQKTREFQLEALKDEIEDNIDNIIIDEEELSDTGTKTYSQMQSRTISRSLSQFSKRSPNSPSQSIQHQKSIHNQPSIHNQQTNTQQNNSYKKHQVEQANFEIEMEMRRQEFERKKDQKNTIETAGFGGAKFGQQASKQYSIEDSDDEELDGESSYRSEEEEEEEEENGDNSQCKSRDPIIQQHNPPPRNQPNKVTFQNSDDYVSSRNSYLRNSLKRKSTRTTNTALVLENVLASFQENVYRIEFPIITQPSVGDFDRITNFRKFYPQFNIVHVLKRIRKYQLSNNSQPTFSLYSFYVSAIEKGIALRKKGENQKSIVVKQSVFIKKHSQPQKLNRKVTIKNF